MWGEQPDTLIHHTNGKFRFIEDFDFWEILITFPNNPNIPKLKIYCKIDRDWFPYNTVKFRMKYPKRRLLKEINKTSNYSSKRAFSLIQIEPSLLR